MTLPDRWVHLLDDFSSRGPLGAIRHAGESAWVLGRSGLFTAQSPWAWRQLGALARQWGVGPAGGFAMMALRAPDQACVIDENGTTSWSQMHRRGNSIARGLRAVGVEPGRRVAVLCRNHRGFLDALCGVSRLGADLYFLNTSMAGPQLLEVLEREGIDAVVHDAEFADQLVGARRAVGSQRAGEPIRLVCSEESGDAGASLPGFVAGHSADDVDPPGRLSKIVLMTSGTTGAPQGAPRRDAGPDAAVALLSRLPLRVGDRVHLAAPMFHTWGLGHTLLGILLGHTFVLRRRFEPLAALETVAEQRCRGFVVVPVMLQRIVEATDPWQAEALAAVDLSALEVVASSGSALPGDLAVRWMDRFGENLYSTYGSTEVAYAAVAGPPDLRANPACAGRVPANAVVKILDSDGREVPAGVTGRIFVGNSLLMPGYTQGGSKEMVDGLMSSGDLGTMDASGVLCVQGRDDEMIVSGGENVFPAHVENAIARLPWVREVAAVGTDDARFGQRLVVFVAVLPGAPTEAGHAEGEVQRWVRQHVASYAVPRAVVVVEELPRNATGKVVKRLLEIPADSER